MSNSGNFISPFLDNRERIFENELGLTNHMRTRSLTDCYKSQWWKTTQKNNLSWNNIHRYINNPLTIKIY